MCVFLDPELAYVFLDSLKIEALCLDCTLPCQ